MMSRQRPLPLHRLREIAVVAMVDPRTVERVLLALPTRGMARERIVEALAKVGIKAPLPARGK